MVSFKNVLLLATVAAASVFPRAGTKTLNDLHAINSDIIALTVALDAYNGGIPGAKPILEAEGHLANTIRTATTDAKNSGPISKADARDILDYLALTVMLNFKLSIQAIEKKKPLFDAAGLTAFVKSNLVSLKDDTDKLGAALIAVPLAIFAADAKDILAKFDADIQAVIKFYS
ncbi:hypothetical protein E4U55_000136 [Claviceps digitariae]|nr:hypothetical protein E4U55_000136 [Claviceps digitariae]